MAHPVQPDHHHHQAQRGGEPDQERCSRQARRLILCHTHHDIKGYGSCHVDVLHCLLKYFDTASIERVVCPQCVPY